MMVNAANNPFAAFLGYKLWNRNTVLDISVLAEFHNLLLSERQEFHSLLAGIV
jgi:hypothetical protein